MSATSYRVIGPVTHETYIAMHRGHIGSGWAGAVAGISQWRKQAAAFAVLSGLAEQDGADNWAMWGGRCMEGPSGTRLAAEHGWRLEPGGVLLESVEWPVAVATLDFWLLDHPRFGRCPLEIKWMGRERYAACQDGLEADVEAQVVHQEYVTGASGVVVAVFTWGKEPLIFEHARDPALVSWLIAREQHFWNEYVIPKRLPPVDDSKSTTEALKRLCGNIEPVTRDLPPESVEWDREKAAVEAEIERMTCIRDTIKNQFHAAMGTALYGQVPGGPLYRAKMINVREYTKTVKAYSYRELRALKDRED